MFTARYELTPQNSIQINLSVSTPLPCLLYFPELLPFRQPSFTTMTERINRHHPKQYMPSNNKRSACLSLYTQHFYFLSLVFKRLRNRGPIVRKVTNILPRAVTRNIALGSAFTSGRGKKSLSNKKWPALCPPKQWSASNIQVVAIS